MYSTNPQPKEFGVLVASVYENIAAWLEPQLLQLGVTWTTFQLLTAVHAANGRSSQIQIASRLGLSAATLSEAVQVQIRKGLLEQTAYKRDRRIKTLRLSPSGQALYRQISILLRRAESAMMDGVDANERSIVEKVLTRVAENLQTSGTKSLS